MKKTWKRLCTGFLALATVVTALPSTPVHAESKQYWTESAERVGIIEKVMNDGSIGSTFNEGMMKVEGETAYCIDINTDFKNGYKTRADASSRMSADQISDVALSLEYVKQYGESHKELNYKGEIAYNGTISKLIENTQNHVFCCTLLNEQEFSLFQQKYKVASKIYKAKEIEVRFVCDRIPGIPCNLCEPTLEDAYLYSLYVKDDQKHF